MSYLVLEKEWNSRRDPVHCYDYNDCIDLNKYSYKPRSVLEERSTQDGGSRKKINDCVHNIEYDIVICNIV